MLLILPLFSQQIIMIKSQRSHSYKAPLVGEADRSLPSGLSLGVGSLPVACVSPGLVDQVGFDDKMGSDGLFFPEEGVFK